MSDRINITVTPPHKEPMLLPYHVNIELTMESKNVGAQVVSQTTTNSLPTVFSIEIPNQYAKRLKKDEERTNPDDRIRITAKVFHHLTGKTKSSAYQAAFIRSQEFSKMCNCYVRRKI